MRAIKYCIVIWLFLYAEVTNPQDRPVVKYLDGVTHIMNPFEPSQGKLALELDKGHEIDPYQYSEVGYSKKARVQQNFFGPALLSATAFIM
jgi:hypothetical protein